MSLGVITHNAKGIIVQRFELHRFGWNSFPNVSVADAASTDATLAVPAVERRRSRVWGQNLNWRLVLVRLVTSGLAVTLTGRSPIYGRDERVTLFTRAMDDGDIFYFFFS